MFLEILNFFFDKKHIYHLILVLHITKKRILKKYLSNNGFLYQIKNRYKIKFSLTYQLLRVFYISTSGS